MKDDDLKLVVQNVLKSQDGFKFVQHLIDESECLNSTVNFDIQKFYFQSGRSSFGDYILNLIRKYDFKNYMKLQEERKD